MFLALRMIHRHPPFPLMICQKLQFVVKKSKTFSALTPAHISSTRFSTPSSDNTSPSSSSTRSIFGTYNTAFTFSRSSSTMKYDQAELVNIEDQCDVCKTATTKACARCKNQLLLQRRVQEVSVEDAQEDVQGADEGGLNRCIQEPWC